MLYMVKDIYISLNDIRKIHYEVDDYGNFLVITYVYDEEHPTRIHVENIDDYFEVAREISTAVREREGK